MKPNLIPSLVLAGCVLAGTAFATSSLTVTLKPETPGATVPADFVGLSFGMKALLPDQAGTHFFSATNTPLITLFNNVGIQHLRVGGTTVESPVSTPIPGYKEIDSLFGFAQAAHVHKIIYSLRLLESDPALHYADTNAAIAKYISDHYRPLLECFALGNEPDLHRVYKQDLRITNFDTYLDKWNQFAAAITAAVPGAKFAGPDGGSGNVSWTTRFAEKQKNGGLVSVITEHFYVGKAGRNVAPQPGIDAILSPDWIEANQKLYQEMAEPVMAAGLPYRFTEANDHYSGGVPDASNTFAGALWALDFLHWWAAHDTRGVDFHNTQWVVNDVITPDADRHLTINPKGYGLKAFNLGSHGNIESLTLSNPDSVNLTAYAVRDPKEHFVTLINKEHGSSAREANVTLAGAGSVAGAEVIFLTAPQNDAAAKTGVTLGGAPINADGPWLGKWTKLKTSIGGCTLKLPPASAAIVKLTVK